VERVRAAEDRAVKLYASRVRVPGFRKGRAPAEVVRKRFSDAIRQQVIQDVIREGWDAAREAEQLQPVADPSVRNLKFEAGQPVEFELVVEVRPEIRIERAGGFTVARRVDPVTDEQVEEQLERIRDQKAAWLPVEGERPAPGHLVRGEVAPMEGEVVHAAKPFSLVLGSGQAIPDPEEQIMRLLPGRGGPVSGRPSRRGPAGPAAAGAAEPPGGEAEGAAGGG
jgi:trigger factor